jgi:hypothetical protein
MPQCGLLPLAVPLRLGYPTLLVVLVAVPVLDPLLIATGSSIPIIIPVVQPRKMGQDESFG